MSHIDDFIIVLKKELKLKGINYRNLAQKIGLSESSVKRVLSDKSLSLDRIEEICNQCEISFLDLCRQVAFNSDSEKEYYSFEQELLFAQNPRLYHVFNLLGEKWPLKTIQQIYDIEINELHQILHQLDRHQLIELHPRYRFKIFPFKNFKKDGPMGKIVLQQTKETFLQSDFKATSEALRFSMIQMTPELLSKIKTKFDKILLEILQEEQLILSEIKQNHEAPQNTNPMTTQSYGVLLASRPWTHSYLLALKKRIPSSRS